ncbi:MAG: MFS transporter [Proteobacteria bacterium]|nr:MAG: MFS transporter [Pseudomonadota bacterium]
MSKTLAKSTGWNGVYSLTIGLSALIIGEFLPVGTLTPIARDLHVTEGVAGQAVSASAIFATVTSLLIAYVTRNFNRKHVILALTGSLALSSFIVAFAPTFAFLIAGRILLGIAVGGLWSMAAAITIRLVSEEESAKAVAFVFAGASFASILAAPLGSFLGAIIGWRNVFLISGGCGALAFLWQAVALPALAPIGNVRLNTIVQVLKLPQFGIALTVIGLLYSGRFASFTFLRPFLEQRTHVDANLVSVGLLTYGMSYFAGNYFSPFLIKHHLRSTLWGMPGVLAAIGILTLVFGSYFIPTLILIFLWGAAFGPGAPAWTTWINKKAPEHAETGGGLFVAAIQGAAAVGAAFGGFVFDAKGANAVFEFSAVVWFLAAVLAYFKITIPRQTTRDR